MKNKERRQMRRVSRLGIGLGLLTAAALAGCDGGTENGSGAGGGAAGAGGGAAGAGGSAGSAGSTGGTSGGGVAGAAGGVVAGAGGSLAGGSGGAAAGGSGGAAAGGSGGAAAGGSGGAAAGGSGGSAAGGSGGAATLSAPAPVGFAVINGSSDYLSVSISLLNANGGLAKADCIHSTTSGGSSTISGDVTLPSQPQRGNALVLIDRGNGAITFLNPTSCAIERQFSVKGGLTRPNPHDIVIVSDSKAYVTRYERNSAVTLGDDLYIMNPATGAAAGRIDLSPYAPPVTGKTVQARPDRAVIAGGKVLVTLNSTTPTYPYTYGEGRLVVVDPATDTVTQSVPLSGLKNCEGLDYLPASRTVLVSCAGTFESPDQLVESGIAVVDVSTAPIKLVRVLAGQLFGAGPVTFLWVLGAPTTASPTRAFTATFGSFTPASPDRLQMFDFVSGAAMSIATSSAFALGRPALAGGRLLVPDGDPAQPRVHVIDVTGTPAGLNAFAPDPVNGFLPREVAAY
jgi:hypothetical protein